MSELCNKASWFTANGESYGLLFMAVYSSLGIATLFAFELACGIVITIEFMRFISHHIRNLPFPQFSD